MQWLLYDLLSDLHQTVSASRNWWSQVENPKESYDNNKKETKVNAPSHELDSTQLTALKSAAVPP